MKRKEQCNRSGQGQAAALKTVARGQRGRPKTMLFWLGILAEEARAEGRQRRAEIWRTTFNSFSRFLGGKDIGLRQMEGRLMQRYENHLLAGGLCPNTTSFYLRNLRSAYSKAVKAKLCPAPRQNPFSEVYTGVAKTRKRAVCADTLRAIRKLDLDGRPDLDYARNLFLLSFYTRGMAFADMAGLRRSDLKEGILCYVRRKTGRPLFIHWEESGFPAAMPDSLLLTGVRVASGLAQWVERERLRPVPERMPMGTVTSCRLSATVKPMPGLLTGTCSTR